MTRLAATLQDAMRMMRSGDLASATHTLKRKLLEISGLEPSRDAPFVGDHAPSSPTSVIERDELRARQPDKGSWFKEASFTSTAGSRRYKIFMPGGNHATALPLVVMLHGCTQTPDDFALGTGMNELAATHRCVIVYPEQSAAANGMRCWNWFRPSDQVRDRGEPAIIAGITREVINQYGVDANRVYVAGLSAGGAMAVVMGRTYPDLFAAVGVHSGLPYAAAHDASSAFTAMKSAPGKKRDVAGAEPVIPTILLHGDSDRTVDASNAEWFARQFTDSTAASGPTLTTENAPPVSNRASAAEGRPYTRAVWHDGRGNIVFEYWLVRGAGHAWFGGDPRGSHTDPKGPDASGEMLRFFLAHKLNSR